MKTKDKIFIWVVVGLLFFSAFALSLVVILGSNQEQEAVVENNNDTTTTSQNSYEGTIVEGVDWPITLDQPLSELVSEDLVVGSGTEVKEGDVIIANYRLAQADGTPVAGNDTFASGTPFTATLAQGSLIDGWVQGIPGMHVGGLRRLEVPASLAYNDGVDLVFDVEIVAANP